jgi:hypothetical protein
MTFSSDEQLGDAQYRGWIGELRLEAQPWSIV